MKGCKQTPRKSKPKKITMKKAILVLIAVVFVIGMLASCNKSVCPAYVIDDNTEQTENNG